MLQLPVELISEIARYISSKEDRLHLLGLRGVCRTLCSLVTPHAFRVLYVASRTTSLAAFKQLQESPQLRVHVQEIEFEYLHPLNSYQLQYLYASGDWQVGYTKFESECIYLFFSSFIES